MAKREVELLSGSTLREFRRGRGLTQEQLADMVGVSYALIAFFESGKRQPSMATAEKIAAALGVTFASLFRPEPCHGCDCPNHRTAA